jgi:hypothetical protein
MVESYKQEVEVLKNRLREIAKRDRVREENYKRQQAYLYEVEKKLRLLNGEYFPDLKREDRDSPLKKKPDHFIDKTTDELNTKTIPSGKEFSILKD